MTGKVVYVGRNTRYGNPIKLGASCPLCGKFHTDIALVLACYKRYLWWRMAGNRLGRVVAERLKPRPLPDSRMESETFRLKLLELDGKVLVCPGCGVGDVNCHARVIEAAIAWLKSSKITP